ncbi:hypothetical protein GCM10010387_17580 [Streptomyces inusitatus]|uniref:Uncharacterized protein n=1 Tax=Streptomyces inusitatus TaxID=68221 RepID=A0A918PVS1_9ACTN|nr:hypothetical protein GCM10010387_17580 [Streptomyces inusitatus]
MKKKSRNQAAELLPPEPVELDDDEEDEVDEEEDEDDEDADAFASDDDDFVSDDFDVDDAAGVLLDEEPLLSLR